MSQLLKFYINYRLKNKQRRKEIVKRYQRNANKKPQLQSQNDVQQ